MKQFITGMLVALLASAIYSCTTGSASGSPVLFKINGRGVSAEEFLTSEPAKNALGNFVFMEAVKSEAQKSGAKVDEKELQTEIENFKKQITMGGSSWEQFLKEQNTTEKELIEEKRIQMLIPALLRKKVKVTDEDVKKVWEDDKQSLIDQYAMENKLPDSEKSKITFEQVKDLARKRVEDNKMGMIQGEILGDIVLGAKLELTAIRDQTKAKRAADKILDPLHQMAEAGKEQSKQARRAAGEEVPEDEPAKDDKATEGEEVPHDHDGDGVSDHGDEAHEGEGEEVPHDHDGDGVSDHGDDAHDEGGEAAPEGEDKEGGE